MCLYTDEKLKSIPSFDGLIDWWEYLHYRVRMRLQWSGPISASLSWCELEHSCTAKVFGGCFNRRLVLAALCDAHSSEVEST